MLSPPAYPWFIQDYSRIKDVYGIADAVLPVWNMAKDNLWISDSFQFTSVGVLV